MKTLLPLFLVILVSCTSAANVFAEVLPKDVVEVRETFEKNGATSCSKAMADTINFLADGRTFTYNALWGTMDANKKPITLDFLISGSKGDYSSNGSITLMPVGDQCVGVYVYSFVAPSRDCKTYIHTIGADGRDWNQSSKYNNGDGGTAYFLTMKKESSVNFIFNDVAGGCSVTKREMIDLKAQK
jgi:hypothetical protein